MELNVNDATRKRVMHTIVSVAVMITFLFTGLFLLAVTIFTMDASAPAYILFGASSLFFGLLMAYVMEDSAKAGHITEAGMLMILPVLLLINLAVPALAILNEKLAQLASFIGQRAASEGAGAAAGIQSLININMPDAMLLSLVVFACFNAPLAYLLMKRKDEHELWWYLFAIIIFAVMYAINLKISSM